MVIIDGYTYYIPQVGVVCLWVVRAVLQLYPSSLAGVVRECAVRREGKLIPQQERYLQLYSTYKISVSIQTVGVA